VGKLVLWSKRQRRRACTANWWQTARACPRTRDEVGGQLPNDRRPPWLNLQAFKDQPADAPAHPDQFGIRRSSRPRRVVRTSAPIGPRDRRSHLAAPTPTGTPPRKQRDATRGLQVGAQTTFHTALLPTIPCIIAGNRSPQKPLFCCRSAAGARCRVRPARERLLGSAIQP
jgi:hypothetical protein